MLPPCTFTLLPLLVLSFIYFFEISCALHSKDSSALIFQIIIYKVSRKEKKYSARYLIYEQVGRICSPLYCWWSILCEEVIVAVYRRMFSTGLLASC